MPSATGPPVNTSPLRAVRIPPFVRYESLWRYIKKSIRGDCPPAVRGSVDARGNIDASAGENTAPVLFSLAMYSAPHRFTDEGCHDIGRCFTIRRFLAAQRSCFSPDFHRAHYPEQSPICDCPLENYPRENVHIFPTKSRGKGKRSGGRVAGASCSGA